MIYLTQSPWTTWTRWAGWVWPKLKGEVKTTEKKERRKGNLGWEEQAGQGWDQEKQGETTHPTELQSLSMEIWYGMNTGQTKHQTERSKQLSRCALPRTGQGTHPTELARCHWRYFNQTSSVWLSNTTQPPILRKLNSSFGGFNHPEGRKETIWTSPKSPFTFWGNRMGCFGG